MFDIKFFIDKLLINSEKALKEREVPISCLFIDK